MGKIKFLHCADLHLDMPFTSLGTENQKSQTRRNDLKKVFTKIIDLAKENEVDLLLISGDIYEDQYVKKSIINFVNDKFIEISGIQVFIVPGNHDPYRMKSFYRDFKWAPNVHILSDDNSYTLENPGVKVYGAGFSDFYSGSIDDINALKAKDHEFTNILLFHGTVDLNLNQDDFNHISSEELNALHMDYVALGHFHNRIDDIGGYGTIYNPGSPDPLGFDEEGEHGVYIGTIEKEGLNSNLDVDFINTSEKYYKNILVEFKELNTDEEAVKQIENKLAKIKKDGKDLKEGSLKDGLFYITLGGFCEIGFKPDTDFIKDAFKNKVFFIKVKDLTRMAYDIEEIMKEPGLRGIFVQKLMKMINEAENETERELLNRSLYYGLDALDRGEVEI